MVLLFCDPHRITGSVVSCETLTKKSNFIVSCHYNKDVLNSPSVLCRYIEASLHIQDCVVLLSPIKITVQIFPSLLGYISPH